jgi:aspartate/methionine/tyrosine aminotransferase
VRRAVAEFIANRDGIAADPECVYLTDGASKGVQLVLRLLIAGPLDGVMVPIPQYPLYSATITLFEGQQVGYYLDESRNWQLTEESLEISLKSAMDRGTRVRGIVVINPGNPTGGIIERENIETVIRFAKKHHLCILADEVYQDNIYTEDKSFCSFAKVLSELGCQDVTLFSFNSCSKGLVGECGHRGGYFEIRNVPHDVASEITKLQSVSLCSNSVGQIVTYLQATPPKKGMPSYELYQNERELIFSDLKNKAKILTEGLNGIDGVSCVPVAGAMYAFPKIEIPSGTTDQEYCLALLENTGICLVPGEGFGQTPGTRHFRATILPPLDQMEEFIGKIEHFHRRYIAPK